MGKSFASTFSKSQCVMIYLHFIKFKKNI
ncbi:hypothetical protein [Methanobrevibacter millerae]